MVKMCSDVLYIFSVLDIDRLAFASATLARFFSHPLNAVSFYPISSTSDERKQYTAAAAAAPDGGGGGGGDGQIKLMIWNADAFNKRFALSPPTDRFGERFIDFDRYNAFYRFIGMRSDKMCSARPDDESKIVSLSKSSN